MVGKIVVLLLVVAFLVAIFLPTGNNGHHSHSSVMTQMKQAATGNVLYHGDYDEHFPLMEWRSAVKPYTRAPKIFEDRRAEKPYVFAHRATLIGISVATVQEPGKTAMLLDVVESSDPHVAELPALAYRKPRNSEHGMGIVGRVDGSAKYYSPTNSSEIR